MQAIRARNAGPRVLHVVETLVAGGAETAVRALCAGLPGAGVDVGVVSVYASRLESAQLSALDVPVLELGRRGRRDLSYFGPLVSALRRWAPDVVHAHLHTGKYAGRLAAVLAQVPTVVFTVHGEELGGPVRWAADRVLNPRTDRFIVFTESQKRDLAASERLPLERIAVIRNGLTMPIPLGDRVEVRARLGLPRDAFIMYSAARFSPEKNVGCAIEALARLVAAGATDVHLALAGAGPLEAELRARALALGMRGHISFLGFRPDAAALGHVMDAFVLASRRERMPFALGEAMLCGLAPVVAPWDGHAEFVVDGRSGFVAADHGAEALAATIMRARANRSALRETGARARTAASTLFDLEEMIAGHAALYRDLSGIPA